MSDPALNTPTALNTPNTPALNQDTALNQGIDQSVFGLPAHDDRHALFNLLEAIRIAESAAHQLAFYTENQRWILVKHNFGSIREACTALAQQSLLGTKRS